MADVVVYGSYGYTGNLIVNELIHQGILPLLAGRNESKLKAQAQSLGLAFKCLGLSDPSKLRSLLSDAKLVIHSAGPFSKTALPMVAACLESGTHYLDITGEFRVFESVHEFHQEALSTGIMLLPGAGFDVVPTDCIATYLAEKVPNAQKLQLAFASKGGGLSPGTSKTMVEGINDGHVIREGGQLKRFPLGKDVRKIDYGPFNSISIGISWGDISTAYSSTSIPEIRVYTASSKKQIRMSRLLWTLRNLVSAGWVQRLIKNQIDQKIHGPDIRQLEGGKSYVVGEITGAEHEKMKARLTTLNGYKLTSMSVTYICLEILGGNFKPGYQTPAMAYGWELITNITGDTIEDMN